jgi:integrase/recombinase XerD
MTITLDIDHRKECKTVVFALGEENTVARPKKLPATLNAQERQALLAAPRRQAPTGHRDLCLITLMLNTGLRAAEVLHLRVRDIDWTSGQLMVREGKGKRDRTLWLNETDLDLLRSWKARRPVTSEFLFTTLHGTPVKDRDLRAMVKRRAQKVGITKDVHPHMLRHTFATDLYRVTKDIRLVQKTLGHADLSTTMIYTHLVDDDVAHAMRTFRHIESLNTDQPASISRLVDSQNTGTISAKVHKRGSIE